MDLRTNKDEWFLDMAERCAKQGTCQRRNYGAIITDEFGTVVSTGYTGAPSGEPHCSVFGACWREKNNIPSGSNYNKCRSVHAEMNALIQSGKLSRGGTMYIAGIDVKTGNSIPASRPCFLCIKMIVNSGIKKLIMRSLNNGIEISYPHEMYKKVESEELGKLIPK